MMVRGGGSVPRGWSYAEIKRFQNGRGVMSQPNKKPPPRSYFCSRCGQECKKYRYAVAIKDVRERCEGCGGNLCLKGELPPGVEPIMMRVEKPRRATAEQRWEWPFGRHRGVRMDATPASYLEWMVANFSGAEIRDSCRRELTRRAKREMDAAKPERKTRKRRRDALRDEFRAIVGPAPKVWQPVESREGEPCPFDVVVKTEPKLFGGVS